MLARGSTSGGLTYAGAGVSIDTAARLIDKIGAEVDRTRRVGSVGGIGGFGGLFDLKAAGYGDDALLVSGTDGVGTKVTSITFPSRSKWVSPGFSNFVRFLFGYP